MSTTTTPTATPTVPGEAPDRYRVSRCVTCDTAYTWKGSAPRPGCLRCGGALTTSTRQRKAGFLLLEGDELAKAERIPTGLPKAIAYELAVAERYDATAQRLRDKIDAGEYVLQADGTTVELWKQPSDYDRGASWTRWNDAGTLVYSGTQDLGWQDKGAAKARDKAAKYERRLAKLGGPLEVGA